MEATPEQKKKRKLPWVLGLIVLVTFTLLFLLQSSNLWMNLTVETTSDLMLLYALSGLNFFAFVIFGFIYLRSIFKLVNERRSLQPGSRIKTRLLWYFFAVSLLPIVAMAGFSYLFMNRALERWFSQIPENVIRQAREMEGQSIADRSAKLDETAKMLALTLGNAAPLRADLDKIAQAGNLAHIEILSPDGSIIAASERVIPSEQRVELDTDLDFARKGNTTEPTLHDGRGFDVASAPLSGGRQLIIVPDPVGGNNVSQIVDNSLAQFNDLKQKQVTIRRVGLQTLGVLTFLLIFASSWIAFYLARGLTAPIKALAEGAGEVARGNLGYRVNIAAEDELAVLVAAFNTMSSTLEENSLELNTRQKYIETVLETLPSGVISFDTDYRVGTINRSAIKMLKLEDADFGGVSLEKLLNEQDREVLEHLLNRATRVGHASGQTVLKRDREDGGADLDPDLPVALIATSLPNQSGVVLVIEDLSELITAQRAAAWQEVARRMAHEIKNPLTPIQLSAERILKRFDKTGHLDNGLGNRINDRGPIGDVVHESTSTILREVNSLKSMVDEFSRFARLPDAKLEIGDLNSVVESSIASFDGRFPDIRIESRLADDLPPAKLDQEQLKRVFVNLIQNAAEAFGKEASNKQIFLLTRHDVARDIIVAEVSDNGKGIPVSDLPKLFQPYFSTKGRGTGLGLAIVRRIIIEHGGKINVSTNGQGGAKFIIEIPVNV